MDELQSRLRTSLQQFFAEELPDLRVVHVDDQKVVVEEVTSGLRVVASWLQLVATQLQPISEGFTVPTGGNWIRLFADVDWRQENASLAAFPGRGFHLKSRAEFFSWDWHLDHEEVDDLRIGNTDVRIQAPSDLFRLLNSYVALDDNFVGWDAYHTVYLSGVDRDRVAAILEQIVFLLQRYYPSSYRSDHPEIGRFLGEDDDLSDQPEKELGATTAIPYAEYSEAIAFYNRGVTIHDDISFIYFYKTIEHFFLINRKGEIERLVRQYATNVEQLMSKLLAVYRESDRDYLKYLLDSMSAKTRGLRETAFKSGLIPENTTDALAEGLYAQRNSLAHGKRDSGFQLAVPNILSDWQNVGWYLIARQLAEVCIENFCYSDGLP